MLGFISENLGSILIGAIVLLVIVLIIIKLVRGGHKSFCSCGDCSSCGSSGVCTINNGKKNIKSKDSANDKSQ